MARIFISYRREDSEIWAARLEESLKREFPSDQVFRDVTAIAPGVDFVAALDTALRETAAAIVVIGPSWLSATDKKGNRRIDQAGDFVRLEVAESLARADVRVFPVLVQGAQMPGEEDLPEPLKPLWRRNALDLTVRHWDNDVAQLVQRLKEVPGLSAAARTPSSAPDSPHTSSSGFSVSVRPQPLFVAAAVIGVVAVLLSIGYGATYLWERKPEQPASAVDVPAVQKAADPAGPAAPQEPPPQAEPKPAPKSEPKQEPTQEPRPTKPAAVVLLRGQDSFTKAFGFAENLEQLAATVQAMSDGRVRIEVLPAGAVVSVAKLGDAVASGALDFAWATPGLLAAKDEAFSLVDSPPFGPAPADYLKWRQDPAVKPVIDELYSRHGVRAIPCGVIWLADLWTNQPMRTASDLKGRKVRVAGSLRVEIFRRAGASYVALPGGDIYPAMEKGLVDSVQFLDPATGVKLGFHLFARALYFPGRLAPASGLDLLVNPAKWDALEPAAQKVLLQACERNARQMLENGRDAQQVAVSTAALKGVLVEELPKDVQDVLLGAWQALAAEKSADPTFKRLYATIRRPAAAAR